MSDYLEEKKKELHPVQIATLFHIRFVTIHPFDDGNGRIGRILMNLILMKTKLAPAIIVREEKPIYLDALVLAQDGDNYTPLLNLIAKEACNAMELRLKAYRGEPLERQDDWEKEAILLKQQLENAQNPLLKISAELVRDCMLGVIEPLFHRFAEKMKLNFVDFFLDNEVYYTLNQNHFESKDDFEEELMKSVNPAVLKINELSMGMKFSWFKLPNYENVSINKGIRVEFLDYNYEVFEASERRQTIIRKRYSEEASKEEGDVLIAQIGKSVTTRIQELIQQTKN